MYKKAVDQKQSGVVQSQPKIQGAFCGHMLDSIPNFIQAPCESIINSVNNNWIVLGRDRPGNRASGYGGRGDTHCGTIDLVVGRHGTRVNSEGEENWVDPDFALDSARIYISQKTDIDKNFNLVAGKVGNFKARSAIGMKADNVRIVARHGIKLVTGTDVKNSFGADVKSITGIDIIAGNIQEELQPMVKGGNLVKALNRLMEHIDNLNGIIDVLVQNQLEFNTALMAHVHPVTGFVTTPSIELAVIGAKVIANQIIGAKMGLINNKINMTAFKMNYFSQFGKKFINSRWNSVN